MSKITIIYGSTTGMTEATANTIASQLGGSACNITDATPDDFNADLLVLGIPTWGLGELQDDWISGINKLDQVDLNGKKVAIFGLGDQEGFGDTFVDGMAILRDKVIARGGIVVGATSTDGYSFGGSTAVVDGKFCGLVIDELNQAAQSAGRIADWCKVLKSEIA